MFLYAVLLLLLNTAWLFLVVLGLPGNWLMVLTTALLAWWQWDQQMFSAVTLLIITGIAIAAEVLEFLLSAAGARRGGGSRWGAFGSIIGAIVGAIAGTGFLPIIGSIIGACLGAFAGALVLELITGKGLGESMRSGRGAAVGRFWGTLSKLTAGAAIWVFVAVAAFL